MDILKIIKEVIVEQIISEGASDILYHFTTDGHVLNILETNEISLTAAIGSTADLKVNSQRHFFLSTTRSKSSGYKSGNAKLVLSGRKLMNNYKIVPVDYWQYSKNPADWDKNSYKQALQSSEQEDRIVSNKPTIPNASGYIMAVHIYNKVFRKKLIDRVIKLCSDRSISLYLYNNKENWLNQRNNIEYSQLTFAEEENGYDYQIGFNYDIASLIAYNDDDNYDKIISYLSDEQKINKFNDILKKRTESDFKINSYSGLDYIKSSIHNIRAKADKDTRFILKLLSNDMIKNKVSTLEDYLKKKQWKGKKTLEDYKEELYTYLFNIVENSYMDYLNDNFDEWVEIDGEYFNHGYESDKLIKVINAYVLQLRKIIRDIIFNDKNEIFKYSFYLSADYLKDYFDLDSVSIGDKLNITDLSNRYYDDIDGSVKKMMQDIIWSVNNVYYDKVKELHDRYLKDLYK